MRSFRPPTEMRRETTEFFRVSRSKRLLSRRQRVNWFFSLLLMAFLSFLLLCTRGRRRASLPSSKGRRFSLLCHFFLLLASTSFERLHTDSKLTEVVKSVGLLYVLSPKAFKADFSGESRMLGEGYTETADGRADDVDEELRRVGKFEGDSEDRAFFLFLFLFGTSLCLRWGRSPSSVYAGQHAPPSLPVSLSSSAGQHIKEGGGGLWVYEAGRRPC